MYTSEVGSFLRAEPIRLLSISSKNKHTGPAESDRHVCLKQNICLHVRRPEMEKERDRPEKRRTFFILNLCVFKNEMVGPHQASKKEKKNQRIKN